MTCEQNKQSHKINQFQHANPFARERPSTCQPRHYRLLRINCPKDNYCIGLPINRNEFVEDLFEEYMSGKDPFPTATPLPIHAGITFQVQQPPSTGGKASQGLLYFQGATFPVKDPLKCAGFIWRDRSWIGATENLINFSLVSLEQLKKSSKKDRGQFIP